MTYVMSDIHGQYDKYLEILKKINFSDDDELFVLGDVVDRGKDPVKVLSDMSMRANVIPILGNHDLTALRLLKKLCVEITEENHDGHLTADIMKELAFWQMDGGNETLSDFRRLSPDEREYLLEYMEEFSPYETITAGENRFLLVHGGVPYDKRHIPMSSQSLGELITERPDYSKKYYKNTYLVTGHTPTVNIGEEYKGRIYKGNGHIAIDCGAGFGMALGCIRLDDMAEFYAE